MTVAINLERKHKNVLKYVDISLLY